VAEGEILVLSQDMTITRDAFLRSLPAAVGNVPFRTGDGEIRSRDSGHRWRIVLTPLPELRIGLIRLGRQRVEIFLTGYDEARTMRFLDRFELYFRRAGG
jgi:hypothetical protein